MFLCLGRVTLPKSIGIKLLVESYVCDLGHYTRSSQDTRDASVRSSDGKYIKKGHWVGRKVMSAPQEAQWKQVATALFTRH